MLKANFIFLHDLSSQDFQDMPRYSEWVVLSIVALYQCAKDSGVARDSEHFG